MTGVLTALARWYETTSAGKHGGGTRDLFLDYEPFLTGAGCGEGAARELAERELARAEEHGLLHRVPIHRRDPRHFSRIRFSPGQEAALFAVVGEPSPTQRRAEWVALFEAAARWPLPEARAAAWRTFCQRRAEAAAVWRGMTPFRLREFSAGKETLTLLSRLLAWSEPSLVRWASSLLCGNSKTLEARAGTLEKLIAEASGGALAGYPALGILPMPPGAIFHGPLRLCMGGEWNDFSALHGPLTLSGADLARVTALETTARRCLTVENQTPFRALAALRSGELLIQTSYPNEATLALLRLLAAHAPGLEFWHFGDSDPKGFDILADLRSRSGLPFRPFQMEYRPGPALLTERETALLEGLIARMPEEAAVLEAMRASGCKGTFEQESLRPPQLTVWPFY